MDDFYTHATEIHREQAQAVSFALLFYFKTI